REPPRASSYALFTTRPPPSLRRAAMPLALGVGRWAFGSSPGPNAQRRAPNAAPSVGMGHHLLAPGANGVDQLVERIGELLDAVLLQPQRDLVHGDASLLDRRERGARLVDVLIDGALHHGVVEEGLDCPRRHRVHGVGADELLGVEDIAILGVLGAGAGPQAALCAGALLRQRVPARTGEDLLVGVVGQLGVGDGGLALQGAQLILARLVIRR